MTYIEGMPETGRYFAVEVNKVTGCHQLLHFVSFPKDMAISTFHACLPRYDSVRDAHLQRLLFKAHNYLGVPE